MRALVSPEQCCAYYSMLAAEQRLKVGCHVRLKKEKAPVILYFFFCFPRSCNRSYQCKLLNTDHYRLFVLLMFVCRLSITQLAFNSFSINFSKDAGYGEKSLFSCEDDNDDPESKNIDDEVNVSEMENSFMDVECLISKSG